METRPLEIFISHAHADQALKEELIKHLSPLKRRGLISHWQDRDISAGAEWADEIDTRLNCRKEWQIG
ncbi:MAG: TIR domain-containing protein [Chthoniobacterales bacterium]